MLPESVIARPMNHNPFGHPTAGAWYIYPPATGWQTSTSIRFATRDETRLTNDVLDDGSPVFSPDGKSLAFIRNGQELRVLDLATKKERLLKKAYLGRPPFATTGSVVWSPDNKWIAFSSYGVKMFRNISVVPAAGGESKPISFLANTFGGNLSWSPDGKYILFITNQRTETSQIARIDLVPRSPKFREDQFRELFNEEMPKTLKPATPLPVQNGSPRHHIPGVRRHNG